MPSFVITKPSWFSSVQELREHDRVLGELKMLKWLSYAEAEARMPEGTVRFGYKGWTTRNLFIRDVDGKDIAEVKSLSWWKRDTAVTIDGKTYEWRQKNWWGTRCGWFGPDNREIMEFRMHWWGKTDIHTPDMPKKTEMLLLLFGMYLMKLQEMEAAAAGTGTYA